MTIFADISLAPDHLSEMEAATTSLPQLPAPADYTVLGILPPRLHFGDEEKPAGALPRWLVRQRQSAVITRGHLLNVAAQSCETAMHHAEVQAALPALKHLTGRLVAYAAQWADGGAPGSLQAAEYVFTIAALWNITTLPPGNVAYDQDACSSYLSQVPDTVRQQVADRLTGLYQDNQAYPRGSYIHSDEMRRYWWVMYGLLHIRDNVALVSSFAALKPYLVLDSEEAWDLLYQTVAADEQMRTITLALTDFYCQILGVPNAPGCADYLRDEMGLGRTAAAAFAHAHQQPLYNADSIGLGRSLLPTYAVQLDETADAIRTHEMAEGKIYTPAEFGQMMAAHRLLMGTDDSSGMLHTTSHHSCLDRLMAACQQTFVDAEQPDSRDMADYMALAVTGLSTVDLGREVPGQIARSFPTYGLRLEQRITPPMLESVNSAFDALHHAIANLTNAAGHQLDLGSALAVRDALPLLTQMSESPMAVSENHPDFGLLFPLDQGGQPYSTMVFSIEQAGARLQMSWLTVPALIQMELEVMGTPTRVRGITMLPFQGIVPRALYKGEIADACTTLPIAKAEAVQGEITPTIPEVAYHRCLIAI